MTFTTSDQEQPNQASEGLDCLRKFALGAHAHHTRRKSLQAIRHMGRLSILSMLVAATVVAQDKPDFSGRWIRETSAGAGPDDARALTVRQPVVRTNVYGTPMPPFFKELSVDRQFGTDIVTETYQIGIEGGMVSGLSPANRGIIPEFSQTRFSVRWDDNRLVIDTGIYSGRTREAGPYTEHTEVWQLDGSGRLIVSTTDRGSGIASTTKTLTYRKDQ
ncbi:MAG: hypothetical protein DMF91_13455 [Acidobacteria bacterium]|nr:MAG: hypothetical protein DMF91_13455 [Acidobacteriota bacterium]